MSSDPNQFIQIVSEEVSKLMPEATIEPLPPNAIAINGRHVNLDDLKRICRNSDSKSTRKVIEQYISSIFSGLPVAVGEMKWTEAISKIMPRIQPNSIFEQISKESVAHTEWLEGFSIVYVIDCPEATVSITTEQLEDWKQTTEDLYEISRMNLEYRTNWDAYAKARRRSHDPTESPLIIYNEEDGYDSSRILLPSLHHFASPYIGEQFIACIPGRDVLAMCSFDNHSMIDALRKRAEKDFLEIPYPITRQMFTVSQDGISKWIPWND